MSNDDFDFWGSAEESTGEYESKGGDFDVIPNGTRCLAVIDEISWKDFPSEEGEALKYIAARWTILKPNDYENRKIFHNIKVYGDDPSGKFYDPEKQQDKRAKERAILWAIDKNAGGKLAKLGRQPTSEELQKVLINKPMYITLRVWESSDKEKKGNWIVKIEPANATQAMPAAHQKAETKPTPKPSIRDDDDDIPF